MNKFLLTVLSVLLLTAGLSLAAHAKGASNVSPTPANDAVKTLITAEPLSVRDDADAVGISASYSVDKASLGTLEETYYVTFGALVARESDGFDHAKLTLDYSKKNQTLKAPARAAMLTVYSTDGKQTVNGTFLTDARDSFSATLNIGLMDVARAKDGAVHTAFLLLEPKAGGEAELFYVARKSASYNSIEEKMQLEYKNNKEEEEAVDAYIDFLQKQVKDSITLLDNTRVMICRDGTMAGTLKEGEKAIWVEYLSDKDPYPDARETVKRNVRAAYIYYPIDFDPTFETTDTLLELGVRRVFAYIATPPYAEDAPGLVCVHGGGGHAYAEYALEAAMNGYAAIAIDTEGCYNMTGGTGTPYSAADAGYKKDLLGHGGKDSFANADGTLSDQWIFNAVMDTALANTVLRSMEAVNEDAVGITGISWGGLITTTAICFDHRYAFASPIYISFHMAESAGISVGGLKTKPFATALWQDAELLKKCPVPTLIISCENDLFASVDTVSMSANDLPNGTLLIKPRLLHGQQYGASIPEIYEFGYNVIKNTNSFITPKEMPTAEMDVSYTMELDIPEGATGVSATLYYLDSPIFAYSDRKQVYYKAKPLTVNEDGTIDVEVPPEAYVYFISFSYYDETVYKRQNGTPYLGSYKNSGKTDDDTKPEKTVEYKQGYIYSSTDIVVFD